MYSKIKVKLKIIITLIFGFIVLVAYQNCSGGKKGGGGGSDEFSSQQAIVSNKALTLLATKCSSCHDSAIKAGGVDVLNLNEMLAFGVVVPNEPLLSLLFTKVQSGQMPPTKALSISEIQTISDWIQLGFATAPVIGTLPVGTVIPLGPTYASIYANILSRRCLGCHNAGNLSGGNSFSTYASTMNTVQRTLPLQSTLYTSTAVRMTMPKSGGALNAAETKAIFDWITAGAANN